MFEVTVCSIMTERIGWCTRYSQVYDFPSFTSFTISSICNFIILGEIKISKIIQISTLFQWSMRPNLFIKPITQNAVGSFPGRDETVNEIQHHYINRKRRKHCCKFNCTLGLYVIICITHVSAAFYFLF